MAAEEREVVREGVMGAGEREREGAAEMEGGMEGSSAHFHCH
jgi:hypothetical protein